MATRTKDIVADSTEVEEVEADESLHMFVLLSDFGNLITGRTAKGQPKTVRVQRGQVFRGRLDDEQIVEMLSLGVAAEVHSEEEAAEKSAKRLSLRRLAAMHGASDDLISRTPRPQARPADLG